MAITKTLLGLVLGLTIGALCRVMEIPSPAPPVLQGALLVLAMTLGHLGADRWLASAPSEEGVASAGSGSEKPCASRPQ
jgi:XapX domain-containing protein